MSLRAALGRLWKDLDKRLGHWMLHGGCPYRGCPICAPRPLPEAPRPPFDWLLDYGPLWEPGSTAFWLEPETCDELASWQNKYHPNEYGLVAVSDDIRIEWIEPVPNPYRQGSARLQNALSQQSSLENYFANSPRNSVPGGWN